MKRFSNPPIVAGLLITIAALIILTSKYFEISSDALLSLTSAVIGGLIATTSRAWVSAQDRQNQLRLAALDKRLEAHQQAYFYWRKLTSNAANKETIGLIVMDAQTWWENNCLYLDPKSREAFYKSLSSASSHYLILQSGDNALITKNWETVLKAGPIIVTGISLPTIGELEYQNLPLDRSK